MDFGKVLKWDASPDGHLVPSSHEAVLRRPTWLRRFLAEFQWHYIFTPKFGPKTTNEDLYGLFLLSLILPEGFFTKHADRIIKRQIPSVTPNIIWTIVTSSEIDFNYWSISSSKFQPLFQRPRWVMSYKLLTGFWP